MSDFPTTRITVPAAELDRLSFCDTDPGALAEWVIALPMAIYALRKPHWHRPDAGFEPFSWERGA